jgi:hypothetical protein
MNDNKKERKTKEENKSEQIKNYVVVCQESSFTHQLLMHECAMLQRRWR